jgi:hypothetical protein
MAYPTVDKPYGLKPINLIWWTGVCRRNSQTRYRQYSGTGYNTNIFYGDVVTTCIWQALFEIDHWHYHRHPRAVCSWAVSTQAPSPAS